MTGLFTPEAVPAMDQRAFDRGADLLALMERADDQSDDAAVQQRRWRAAGGRIAADVADALA
ncbi:MAG: hypothetical protein M3276_00840, partial [Actinomycetota bacterium]|nr:hypothetical protein [Actinomycetota bacterium]